MTSKSQSVHFSAILFLIAFGDKSFANSVYDGRHGSDSVTELTANDFNDFVYHKNRITLVNFYLHWCGHCIQFSHEWKRLATDIRDWQTVVRLAAIDCAADVNKDLCQSFGITRFPRIRLFGVDAPADDHGIHIEVSDMTTMKNEIIDSLLKVHQKYANYLNIFPIEINSKDELFNSLVIDPGKQNFVFLENFPTHLTAQVILDFSSLPQYVNIYRVLDRSGDLSRDLFAHSIRLPSLVRLHGNHTFQMIASAYSNNEELLRQEFYFKIRELLALTPSSVDNQIEVVVNSETLRPKPRSKLKPLAMSDLYNTLRYTLHKEVPRYKVLNSTQVAVLKTYYQVIYKYFPFDNENVRRFFKRMNIWFANKNSSLKIENLKAAMKISDGFLPPIVQWIHCAGSRPHFRGYPCGLWSLFHVLTVVEYNHNRKNNSHEVLHLMSKFITNFFSCDNCSKHFERISRRLNGTLTRPESSVLWLWKVHNQVNHRTRGTLSEDPLFPKVQFPTQDMCPNCYKSNSEFNETSVLAYLLQTYEPKRLTKSSEYYADQRILSKNSSRLLLLDLSLLALIFISLTN